MIVGRERNREFMDNILPEVGKFVGEIVTNFDITGLFGRSTWILLLVMGILYFYSYRKYFRNSVLYKKKMVWSRTFEYIGYVIIFLIFNIFILSYLDKDFSCKIKEDMSTYITIITTVLISFFGLTAASYTFQINDMHTQQNQFPQYELFIDEYLGLTRFKFTIALYGTVLVSGCSVFSFLIDGICSGNYQNGRSDKLEIDMILCSMGVEIITWMLYLNWVIFFHERYINKYAQRAMNRKIAEEKNRFPTESMVKYLTQRCIEYCGEKIKTIRQKIKEIVTDVLEIMDIGTEEDIEINQQKAQLENYLRRLADLELIIQRLRKNKMHVIENYPLQDREILVFCPGSAGSRNESLRIQSEKIWESYQGMIIIRNAIVRLHNYQRGDKFLYDKEYFSEERLKAVENYIRNKRVTGEDFFDMDLSEVNLFQNGKLENSNFRNSNLQDANLKGSQCRNTSFSGCMLSGMYVEDRENVREPGVTISRSTCLENVNFSNSNMESSRLCFKKGQERFSMKGGNFDQVIFSNSHFEGVDFSFSSFGNAQMFCTSWKNCYQKFAIFIHTLLSNSILERSDFLSANFSDAILVSMKVVECRFCNSRLHHANLTDTKIEGGDWSRIMATGAAMKSMIITSGDDGASVGFGQAVLQEVDFTDSNIQNADFTGAQINDCIFTNFKGEHIIFNDADMRDCLFNNTEWKKSIFDYVQFDGTILKKTFFRKCRLSNISFMSSQFVYREPREQNEDEMLRKWEQKVGFADTEQPDMHHKSIFSECYLEKVSFYGVRGLSPGMFTYSTVVLCDFRNTGLSEAEFRGHVKELKNSLFGEA